MEKTGRGRGTHWGGLCWVSLLLGALAPEALAQAPAVVGPPDGNAGRSLACFAGQPEPTGWRPQEAGGNGFFASNAYTCQTAACSRYLCEKTACSTVPWTDFLQRPSGGCAFSGACRSDDNTAVPPPLSTTPVNPYQLGGRIGEPLRPWVDQAAAIAAGCQASGGQTDRWAQIQCVQDGVRAFARSQVGVEGAVLDDRDQALLFQWAFQDLGLPGTEVGAVQAGRRIVNQITITGPDGKPYSYIVDAAHPGQFFPFGPDAVGYWCSHTPEVGLYRLGEDLPSPDPVAIATSPSVGLLNTLVGFGMPPANNDLPSGWNGDLRAGTIGGQGSASGSHQGGGQVR